MSDFSQRFEFIYKLFSGDAETKGHRASKLALAKYLGISQGRMQSWESGQVPKPDDLELLHDTFGLSYEWLVTGKGEPLEKQEPPKPPDDSLGMDKKFAELADAVERMSREMQKMRDDIAWLQKRLERGEINSDKIAAAVGQE